LNKRNIQLDESIDPAFTVSTEELPEKTTETLSKKINKNNDNE
jgi:hypothetical protein